MENNKCSVFWFRRDLRVHDNTGLHAALKSGNKVVPIFIFDTQITEKLPKDDARISFIYDSLKAIHEEFQTTGGGLKIYQGNPLDIWQQLLAEYDVAQVYTNRDYEPYATERDDAVAALLATKKIPFHTFKDQVIFEKKEVVKKDGTPYTVFTPFKNQWLKQFSPQEALQVQPSKELLDALLPCNVEFPPMAHLGFVRSSIAVKPVAFNHLEDYDAIRDFPWMDKTSYVSPHLRFGTISVRAMVSLALKTNATYLSELIWREFFMQILFNFPQVEKRCFKSKYERVAWRNNEEEFEHWCNGTTGYPIVDAGMRELNATGYMHNRVRMITASFLCKHLLIDWRWGEAYFASKLLDYDLSANNGNWQWAASTGCDAVPYFRIFNPTEQVKKFDKQRAYIKKWVPDVEELTYPQPIVDHKFARERALKTYKDVQ